MATSWSGGVNFEVGAKAFAEKINISLMERLIFKPSRWHSWKAFKVSGTVKNGWPKLVTPGWAMIGEKIKPPFFLVVGRLDGFRKDAPLAL